MRSDIPSASPQPLSGRYAPRWTQAWWQARAVWPLQRMSRAGADRRASRRALRHARIAANRIFAVEHFQMPLLHLADLARRELRAGLNPGPALLDSLALASIAAQRTLGMRAHLAQMAAAVLTLQDRAAELGCGEGKTLALALAAAVRALGGMPVHLVVRDERLVQAGVLQMRPFFEALGLTVAAVSRAAGDPERREAYQADVCYVTAQALMIDDLRNRFAPAPIGFRPPELACALVDDIDGVLIDGGDTQQFFNRYRRLGGVSATLVEARGEMASGYGLGVSVVASIYPCFRRELGLTVCAGTAAWRDAVVSRVLQRVIARRPVLVATAGEAASRMLAAALHEQGVDATVIVGSDPAAWHGLCEVAGRVRAVTICSKPEGDGNVIVLEPIARAAGGLAVIATFLGPSRRADRQLAHLTGRRSQPGTVEAIVQCPGSRGLGVVPAPLMRSWLLVRRYFGERRAEMQRSRHARRLAWRYGTESEPAPGQRVHHHLQHEGH